MKIFSKKFESSFQLGFHGVYACSQFICNFLITFVIQAGHEEYFSAFPGKFVYRVI